MKPHFGSNALISGGLCEEAVMLEPSNQADTEGLISFPGRGSSFICGKRQLLSPCPNLMIEKNNFMSTVDSWDMIMECHLKI